MQSCNLLITYTSNIRSQTKGASEVNSDAPSNGSMPLNDMLPVDAASASDAPAPAFDAAAAAAVAEGPAGATLGTG
jgi:hypothetical protein